jgi:hypothetical protein
VLAAVGVAWFGQVNPHGTPTFAILGPSLIASTGLGLRFVTVAATATSNVTRRSWTGQRDYHHLPPVRRQHRLGRAGHRRRHCHRQRAQRHEGGQRPL